MATRRFSGRRRGSSPRRRTVWARTSFASVLTTGAPFNAVAVDLLADFQARYGADPLGCTLLRTRGIIATQSNSANGVAFTVGVRVGQDRDASLTDTEQNPMTNGQYLDWLLYEPFVAGSGAGVTLPWNGSDIVARVIDVKAKRKLEELDQTLILNAGSSAALVTTASLVVNLSMLLALP